jgi:hypothetical protein
MVKFLLALFLALACVPTVALAENCNGPGDDDCSCEVNGEPTPLAVVCGAFCDADAEAQAKAICGDATAVNESSQLAFLVSVTKNSCKQAQIQAQSSVQICGGAAASCDQAVSVECPACPNVIVQDKIERCKSVKVLKSGVIRKRGCVSFLDASRDVCE